MEEDYVITVHLISGKTIEMIITATSDHVKDFHKQIYENIEKNKKQAFYLILNDGTGLTSIYKNIAAITTKRLTNETQ